MWLLGRNVLWCFLAIGNDQDRVEGFIPEVGKTTGWLSAAWLINQAGSRQVSEYVGATLALLECFKKELRVDAVLAQPSGCSR